MLGELVRRVSGDPERTVLDAGCGTGRMVPLPRRTRGLEVTGADLSPGMIAVARERLPSVRLEVAGLDALPFASAILRRRAGLVLDHPHPARIARAASSPSSAGCCGRAATCCWRSRPVPARAASCAATARRRRWTRTCTTRTTCAERLSRSGFAVDAVLRRAAVRERHDQGFVLARSAADRPERRGCEASSDPRTRAESQPCDSVHTVGTPVDNFVDGLGMRILRR